MLQQYGYMFYLGNNKHVMDLKDEGFDLLCQHQKLEKNKKYARIDFAIATKYSAENANQSINTMLTKLYEIFSERDIECDAIYFQTYYFKQEKFTWHKINSTPLITKDSKYDPRYGQPQILLFPPQEKGSFPCTDFYKLLSKYNNANQKPAGWIENTVNLLWSFCGFASISNLEREQIKQIEAIELNDIENPRI